jgi:quinohemoprotein ethanol dehydrogenase
MTTSIRGFYMRRLLLASFGAVAVISCSTTQTDAPVGGGAIPAGRVEKVKAGEWALHGNDSNEQRYSTLKQVNADTVRNLGLAWTADMPERSSWQGTPIMVGGVLYVTTPWSYLYAYDAATGKQLWMYSPRVQREIAATQLCCGNQNRGATYWNGKIIWATLDGRLVAVDAKSGKLVWETATFDPMKDPMSITGAPRVGNGVVFIGSAGGEYHQRGFISGYDANTGKKLWRFYTVPGDPSKGPDGEASDEVMAMAARTWKGDWWKTGGGATVWEGMVYDRENDLIIFGTGNGAPWPAEVRSPGGGDNLFTASIVALHATTGKYAWHYQTTPMESFDFDNNAPLTIADLMIDGQKKHVVMQIPKNGVFYVIEAKTGKVQSAQLIVPFANWLTGFDKANNWAPILNPAANYGATGKGWFVQPFQTHVWSPQAFNPNTGLVYVNVLNATYGMVAEAGAKMGNQLLAINLQKQPEMAQPVVPRENWLSAWNPVTQTEAWRIRGGGSGTMTTAGNLLFQSEGANLVAYSADNGAKLWTGATGATAGSGPMTYEVGGEQYIAAVARVGTQGTGRVVAYKLGGKAALPTPAPATQPVLNPPANFGTEAQVAAGMQSYTASCAICHEGNARNSTGAPDLRYSPFLASTAAFNSVVIDGIKMDGGMKSFKGALSNESVEAIRAHIVSLANTLKSNPAAAGGAGFGARGGPGGGPGGAGGARAGGPGRGGAAAAPPAGAQAPVAGLRGSTGGPVAGQAPPPATEAPAALHQ